MKRLAVFALAALALPALAADWEGTVTVKYEGADFFVSTQKYSGMTDNQVRDLKLRANAVLGHAQRNADKGGPYTITWAEKGSPVIETAGLHPNALVSVVRKMTQWNAHTVDHLDARQQRGAKKLWGQ